MTNEQIAKLANDTVAAENEIKRLRVWEEAARKDEVVARVDMSFSDRKYARSHLGTYLDDKEIVALIGVMILKQEAKLIQLEAQMKKLRKA